MRLPLIDIRTRWDQLRWVATLGTTLIVAVWEFVRVSLLVPSSRVYSVVTIGLAFLLAIFASVFTAGLLKRLDEARRRVTQVSILQEVAMAAARLGEFREVIRVIVEELHESLGFSIVQVWLLGEKAQQLVITASVGYPVPATIKPKLGKGIIGWAALHRQPVSVPDVSKDPRYICGDERVRSELAVPLEVGDRLIGVLNIEHYELNAFSEDDVRLLSALAGQLSVAIESARLYEETKRLAATDPLTGVWNRRHVEERLRTEVARARRFHHPLSTLVMDIDNLKLFNDTYGHPAGDKVIRTVAQVILTSCREIDIVGRYGGDEFAVILPEADAHGAATVASRILAALQKKPFQTPDGTKVPISISIGAASYPSDGGEADRLFSLADATMYRVKVAGGGQFASLSVGPEEVPKELAAPFDVLQGLLIAVDSKDRYTFRHSQEVTERALALARAVGVSEEEMRTLEIAGKFHDIGKIGIPTSILRRPAALTPKGWEIVQLHPRLGHLILQQIPGMEAELEAVLHHHEYYDGTGYPDGLEGEEIPLLARILAVADAFSAMMTDRPYRQALTVEAVLDELRRNAGKQLDPDLVQKFIELVEKGQIE